MYLRVCDRKGELWALKSVQCAPAAARGGWRRAVFAGVFSDPTFNHFSSSFCLWMKPDRADVVVIKGKRSDGPEAFGQTFLKLSPFVGTYAALRPF